MMLVDDLYVYDTLDCVNKTGYATVEAGSYVNLDWLCATFYKEAFPGVGISTPIALTDYMVSIRRRKNSMEQCFKFHYKIENTI